MKKDNIRQNIAEIERILYSTYGEPKLKNRKRLSVLDEMILTILSQNTNDKNSMRAFERLKERYPANEDLYKAEPQRVSEAIKIGGLGNIKAGYILGLLKWLDETTGTLDCEFICRKDTEEVINMFRSVKGIGVKTVAVSLAFACGRDIFPVDTHVFRVMKRLGALPDINSPEKAYYYLKDIIPEGKRISMHMNVIKHGREICDARRPLCNKCPLTGVCDYYQSLDIKPAKTAK